MEEGALVAPGVDPLPCPPPLRGEREPPARSRGKVSAYEPPGPFSLPQVREREDGINSYARRRLRGASGSTCRRYLPV